MITICRCTAKNRMELVQLVPTSLSLATFSSDTPICCGPECCSNYSNPNPLYASPHFWLWVCLAVFVLSFVVSFSLHSALAWNRKGFAVHAFIERLSSGPYQTTQFAEGIIIPRVVYRERRGGLPSKAVEDTNNNTYILNVENLLQYIDDNSKIISGEAQDSITRTNHPASSIIKTTLTTPLQPPLSPSYFPTRQVAQVWDSGYRLENFERTVLPPGFIDV